jgi:tetraacyldisaccharide 4'-kinase
MPGDTAAVVGDEALLLATYAPTWVGADRASSARQALAVGANALILDDGLQNPTLTKDLSFLVVDGGAGFGNGRLLPAGPLREPIASGANRCQAAVLIGDDTTGALQSLPAQLPVLRATLVPKQGGAELNGRQVVAFAGIGRPEKFFATVSAMGAVLVERISLPDHQPLPPRLFRRVIDRARSLDALVVTTAKDAARLTLEQRPAVHVVEVTLAWENPGAVEAFLDQVVIARTPDQLVEASSAF